MIRKLNSRDAGDIEYCLQQKPMFGQFVRIFIKDLGIDIENCNIFGYFEKTKLTCIFSVVLNNLMVYSYADVVPAKEILDFLKAHNINFSIMKGEESVLQQFTPYVKVVTKYGTLLCKLFREKFTPVNYNDIVIERANSSNVDEILGFFNNTIEYKMLLSPEDTKKFVNFGYTYFTRENGKIVALTMCNYMSRDIANISVLVTAPNARNKGYGSKLLSKICEELLKISNSCSICYDVMNVLSIYRTVGFKEIDKQAIYIVIQ